jgi:hypothetical protein
MSSIRSASIANKPCRHMAINLHPSQLTPLQSRHHTPMCFFIDKNKAGRGRIRKREMKNVNMVFLPRGNQDGPVFRLWAPYSPAFPSWFVHDSGSSGFRSHHGCGAAGAFTPLPHIHLSDHLPLAEYNKEIPLLSRIKRTGEEERGYL